MIVSGRITSKTILILMVRGCRVNLQIWIIVGPVVLAVDAVRAVWTFSSHLSIIFFSVSPISFPQPLLEWRRAMPLFSSPEPKASGELTV